MVLAILMKKKRLSWFCLTVIFCIEIKFGRDYFKILSNNFNFVYFSYQKIFFDYKMLKTLVLIQSQLENKAKNFIRLKCVFWEKRIIFEFSTRFLMPRDFLGKVRLKCVTLFSSWDCSTSFFLVWDRTNTL